ncbi:MAG: FGGY family carbohydrate kinase [Devosia sp.]
MSLIAAIDQGTTSTKGLLVAEDGSMRSVGSGKHRQMFPQAGWVEHDGVELLANVVRAIEDSVAAGAKSLAFTNQGETVIAWDKQTGQPICNAIVWQDQRTADEVERLRAGGVESEVRSRSGLPLDAYFSASKLKWILDKVPEAEALQRAGRLGLGTSDSYFLHVLTGRYITDVTTAARTSLMNLDSCAWDQTLCQIFGVPLDLLPQIVECDEPIGSVRGAELSVSVVDQVAALYGHGCRKPGDMKVTFGTGAFALILTDGRPTVPNTVHTACWGGPAHRAYAADGGVYTAGAAIEWLVRLGLLQDASELSALAGPSAVSKGVCFVPALSGLACPHWDRTATGLWIGLDSGTERQDLIKAVLEGIAFRTVEVLEALDPDGTGGLLSVDGGLTRSRYFLDFFCNASGREIVVPANDELTAFGAAQLAAKNTIPVNQAEQTMMIPSDNKSMAEWRDRFTVARQRSSGWRR